MPAPSDLARLAIRPDLRLLSFEEGLRAALAVGAVVAVEEVLSVPLLLEVALGALLTCLCDPGGPVRKRVPVLLLFGALGAAITVGFGLLRGQGLLVTVPLAVLAVFCAGMGRVWGQSGMQLGNLLTVVLILALDRPETLLGGLELAGAFWGGSLWASLLTLLVWRIHPFRPARRAVSEAYRRLGLLAADLTELIRSGVHDPERWEAHARQHRRAARDSIEAARLLLADTLRQRGAASLRARQGLIRLEAADQLFGALIALSDSLEYTDVALRPAADRMVRLIRVALRAVEVDSLSDSAAPPAERVAVHLRVVAGIAPATPPALAPIAAVITERLRSAVRVAAPDPVAVTEAARSHWLTPLRANLSWGSAAFRHALRAATVAVPALIVTLLTGHSYAHWLTITLILTMQPFYANTWQRAVERIGGTMLGGLAAAAIGLLIQSPLAIAAAMVPLLLLAFAVRSASYGLFMACLTPPVVLLTELGHADTSEWAVAGLRALYTLLGGGLAVAGALLLWPSWEPGRLANEARTALRAHAAWLAALGSAGVEAARRAAGLASNNMEASLSRALQEPRRAPKERAVLDAALVVDAALRRLAGGLSAMQIDPGSLTDAAGRPWRDWAEATLRCLADQAALPGRPAGTPPAVLERLVDRVELTAGAVRRYRAGVDR